uniref:HTH psq-type domain-containing protein n=1 Tax=Timema poppense TaxID=170557 RepID=A0A7R9CRZ1_TIMPO|nr:unnamed protein product [Timema poppensis]
MLVQEPGSGVCISFPPLTPSLALVNGFLPDACLVKCHQLVGLTSFLWLSRGPLTASIRPAAPTPHLPSSVLGNGVSEQQGHNTHHWGTTEPWIVRVPSDRVLRRLADVQESRAIQEVMSSPNIKKRKIWDSGNMCAAVASVRKKEMGLKKASKSYNVPRPTLKGYVKSKEESIEKIVKGKRQVSSLSSAESGALVTVTTCISDSGVFVPPLMVFHRKNMKKELLEGAPPGTIGATHMTVWIQVNNFTKWFTHFTTTVKPSLTYMVVLVLEGYYTHVRNSDVIDTAQANGVTIVCLPPHCTQETTLPNPSTSQRSKRGKRGKLGPQKRCDKWGTVSSSSSEDEDDHLSFVETDDEDIGSFGPPRRWAPIRTHSHPELMGLDPNGHQRSTSEMFLSVILMRCGETHLLALGAVINLSEAICRVRCDGSTPPCLSGMARHNGWLVTGCGRSGLIDAGSPAELNMYDGVETISRSILRKVMGNVLTSGGAHLNEIIFKTWENFQRVALYENYVMSVPPKQLCALSLN